MSNRKLIHPIAVQNVMASFANEIHSLTTADGNRPKCKMISTRIGFCAFMNDIGKEEFRIGYNFELLYSVPHKPFSDHFRSICPTAKGFALVTLSLLHELGHFHTEREFEGYDRHTELIKIRNMYQTKAERDLAYFNLPDEKAATEWAIAWLQDPEHRKIAKRFEKKFFQCFK